MARKCRHICWTHRHYLFHSTFYALWCWLFGIDGYSLLQFERSSFCIVACQELLDSHLDSYPYDLLRTNLPPTFERISQFFPFYIYFRFSNHSIHINVIFCDEYCQKWNNHVNKNGRYQIRIRKDFRASTRWSNDCKNTKDWVVFL